MERKDTSNSKTFSLSSSSNVMFSDEIDVFDIIGEPGNSLLRKSNINVCVLELRGIGRWRFQL